MSRLLWTHNLDWEVAWLLMTARQTQDDTVRYILVCMAAIVASEPSTFVSKMGSSREDGSPYTVDDLRGFCAPRLHECVGDGMLWFYTGIYLKYRNSMSGEAMNAAITEKLDSYIVVSQTAGWSICYLQ
ncbi:hypothetical protein SAMD00023353_4900910 [Rosellinia necatrix]|uniref:Uncharacterized protein n=1 Tax=Rosellinia necatrix TaxID=77044 RepID=A0A1S8A9P1_ROSNE|nr:hypothetical protein SAMD00023353_4900910 [Rosellinia necatrix]